MHGAGRTDAGVHALGQVASAEVTFTHDPAAILRGLNASLPADVRVVAIEDAPSGFHARFSARSKTYRYIIRNSPVASPFDRAFAWHLPEPLDDDRMRAAADTLVGTHDFAAFQSTGSETSGTVRTITRSELTRHEAVNLWGKPYQACLLYDVSGNGFLRHMVRAIVGTLVEIGRGRRSSDSMASLLARGDRSQAGATAPPHGLFLVGVDYD